MKNHHCRPTFSWSEVLRYEQIGADYVLVFTHEMYEVTDVVLQRLGGYDTRLQLGAFQLRLAQDREPCLPQLLPSFFPGISSRNGLPCLIAQQRREIEMGRRFEVLIRFL
jgi:hypothetical protein